MSYPNAKPLSSLSAADLRRFPVWQFVDDDLGDDTLVRPVKRLPVSSLANKLVGIEVQLANGRKIWALIGNLKEKNARLTEHFLTLSLARDNKWFFLARYHDLEYAKNGPDALARFLGLTVDEIFPISYNVTPYVTGDLAALAGSVPKEPRRRLSREEIIALAVP